MPFSPDQKWGKKGVSRHHYLAGALALLFSAGLHFAAYEWLPGFRLTQNLSFEPPADYTAFALKDRLETRVEDPAVVEPEQPVAALVEASLEGYTRTDFEKALAPWLAEVEPVAPADFRGVDEVLHEPVFPDPVLPFEARQEVLAIDETLFADEDLALPRKLEPELPRVVEAPDMVLPVDTLAAVPEEQDLVLPDPAELLSSARFIPAADREGSFSGLAALVSGLTGTNQHVLETPELASLVDAEQGLDAIAEPEDLITEVEPIETLLGVRLYRYRHPGDDLYTYFKLEVFRQGAEQLKPLPRDVVFVQDCSESMSASKLRACRKGLLQCVDMLHDLDRFNVVAFRDETDACFDTLVDVNPRTLAVAKSFIDRMRPRGKTDVHGGLQLLQEWAKGRERPFIAVLITDGRPTMGLVDSAEIIEAFTRENEGTVSLFSIGGGRRVNTYLLDLMSYRNRGGSIVVQEQDFLPQVMQQLTYQLSRPVLLNLRHFFSSQPAAEVYPKTLTHLYLDRPLELFGRVPRSASSLAVQVIGEAEGKKHDMVFSLDWKDALPAEDNLRLSWAWQKMYDLIGTYTADKSEASLQAIRELAETFGLRVPYAYSIDAPVSF